MHEIIEYFEKHPFIVDFIICGVKASAADAITQRHEMRLLKRGDELSRGNSNNSNEYEKTMNHFDWPRNISFIIYGGVYQGDVQEMIFNHLYPYLFGDNHDFKSVFPTVLVNNLFTTPFIRLPLAYLIKSLVIGTSCRHAIDRYIEDVRYKGLLIKYWILWIPIDTLNFSVMPDYLRVTFNAFISFFWLMILSSIAGVRDESELPTTTVIVSDDHDNASDDDSLLQLVVDTANTKSISSCSTYASHDEAHRSKSSQRTHNLLRQRV